MPEKKEQLLVKRVHYNCEILQRARLRDTDQKHARTEEKELRSRRKTRARELAKRQHACGKGL